MQPPDQQLISTEEKIRILLHEYATLRQEIIARTTQGFQLMSVGSVILAWVILTQAKSSFFWPGVSGAMVIFLIAVWFTLRDIGRAASRIKELEADINRRAGEPLLLWESKWSPLTTGFWGRAKLAEPDPTRSQFLTGNEPDKGTSGTSGVDS